MTYMRRMFARLFGPKQHHATLHTPSGAVVTAILRRGEMSFDRGESWQPISGKWTHAFDDKGNVQTGGRWV